ncbi:cytochrome P450 family protein [Streptomyces sp. cmx-18-6]|uniref:cytochrome P450 family protein n=1 Tax=Streptomyces sp. cmx-18-6 TaxID=2790930 RepID=UPI00397F6D37
MDVFKLDPAASDRIGEDSALRARGPLTQVDILGVQAWAVSNPQVLKDLLTDKRVSKDPRQHYAEFESVAARWPLAIWIVVQNMFTAYGGDHRKLRRLVAPAFSARRTEQMIPVIRDIADELLDAMQERARRGETVDVRAQFAHKLPIQVIFRLMGLAPEWEARLAGPVHNVFATTLPEEEQRANYQNLAQLLSEFVAEKRERPGDDLTGDLITASDEGTQLSGQQLVDTLILVISAGFETTVGLITNALRNLLTHPDELRRVQQGPAEGWDAVVEETLRRDAPVAFLPLRYAVEDIDIAGVRIGKGEAILAAYSATGRDATAHERADEFDVGRSDKAHLAFGHGVHFCIGAPLARAEGHIGLSAFFDRFPDARLADGGAGLAPMESIISNSPRELPVDLLPSVERSKAEALA